MRVTAVVRALAVTAAALVLAGAPRWAYAAPASGTDRTGTWIALAAAVVIALAAGLVVLFGPGRAGRGDAGRGDAGGGDTGRGRPVRDKELDLQRALAAETHARRAAVGQPAPDQWDQPAPDQWDQPAAGQWDQPAAGQWDQPAAGQWDRPAPDQWDQPAPEQWDRPAPDQWNRPAPPAAPGPDQTWRSTT